MSSKRKVTGDNFQRSVRVRHQTSEEKLPNLSKPELVDTDDELDDLDEREETSSLSSEAEIEDLSDDSSNPREATRGLISFGALAKAQSTLDQSDLSHQSSDKINNEWIKNTKAKDREIDKKAIRKLHRSNSHAPTEISSKKAVTRRREVIPVTKRQARDPRFESLSSSLHPSVLTKAYAFLDEYRETEIKELKTAIKTTKDPGIKEDLKKTLLIMESRKKMKLKKLKEEEVLQRHKKQEKALVKQGKQPFYLKKTEQKKQVLLDQFSELSGKKLDRVIERRRKKLESKEKKKMPYARRA